MQQIYEKLKTFNLTYFIGKSYFEDDEMQNYLVFEPIFKYFKTPANSNGILAWKYKCQLESIKLPPTPASDLDPEIIFRSTQMRVKFDMSCLKQEKIAFKHNVILDPCSI